MPGDRFSEPALATKRPFPEHNNKLAAVFFLVLSFLSAFHLVCQTTSMFFDTLLNVANRAIKDLPFARTAQPASSGPRVCISPLMYARTQSQSPSTDTSSNLSLPPSPLIFSPNIVEKGEPEVIGTKKRFSGRSRRSAFSGTTAGTEDSYKPVPLHHPHPKHLSPVYNSSDMWSFRDDPIYLSREENTPPSSPSPSPSPDDGSRSPSLVPTVVATRSPSPQPHPCVDQARALGIKVRDFAHEDHGVRLAPPIPDLDQLKISYYLYRSAGLTPPSEAMENLKTYDPEWFMDAERRFEAPPSSKTKPGTPVCTWKRETERGVVEGEPLDAPVQEHPLVGKVTSWLETVTISPENGSQEQEVHL